MPLKNLSKFQFLAATAFAGLTLAACEATVTEGSLTDATIYSGTADMTREEGEEVYLARFQKQSEAALQGGGLPSYDPLIEIAGTADYQPLPTGEAQIDSEALSAAQDFVAKRNTSAFMIWQNGAIVHEEYFGDADADYLVNAKSLAKPLTAIAVGRAIMGGHISSVDQPVADFITEWKEDPGKSKIKVRHLLDMRSGLLQQARAPEPEDILNRAYLHPFHEDVIVNDYPLTAEPGTKFQYANANSELVAVLIERATGEAYQDYLTQEVFTPLGAKGGTIWINRPEGVVHAGCCIQLPAESYLRLGILLLQDGVWESERLLPEGYVDAMRAPAAENPFSGMGVFVPGPFEGPDFAEDSVARQFLRMPQAEPFDDADIFYFDGNSNQTVYISQSEDLVILRTGSWPSEENPWDLSALPNMIMRGLD